MRGLPARRVASSVLCATVLIGIAGPAAVAADNDSARKHVHAASSAPVPGADALLAQVKGLGDVGGVLTPVTDLLTQALKADNGQLSADQAKTLGDAVTAAIAKVTAAAPAAPAVPAVPAAPAVPAVPAVPAAPALPSLKSGDDSKAEAPADLAGDALASLQKAVATLLAAVTSGDVAGVVPAVTGVVTGLVNVVAATLLGGGLPAPSLPGLPALPSLPSTSALPAVPAVPAVPALPGV
ncbi:hypothetical protein [Streptomyces sp. Agncl-13]|uniref:hypothetical protein n=1 Tax=Streptomyces sp. Agncl-13 TaxID=3400628 RepID=UPI003A85764D